MLDILGKKQKKRKRFKNALDFANSVVQAYNSSLDNYSLDKKDGYHPLLDVVRLLCRNIQSEYMSRMIYLYDSNNKDLTFDDYLFSQSEVLNKNGDKLYYLKQKRQINEEREIQIGRDVILAWPWERTRLINTISNIGKGRSWGGFKYKNENHFVELWLPLGITWVNSGNHSLTSGIIQGCGTIKPIYIYDISEVYDYVYCDGVNYIRKEDNSIISPVRCEDLAVVFEIGRIMKENNISF